jgi:hypothetical protein
MYIPEALKGEIKLIRNIGTIWTETRVLVNRGDDGVVLETIRLNLGCLNTNWTVTNELSTEEIPLSCSTGVFTLDVSKKYAVSIGTRNLNPWLLGALQGMTITAADFWSTSEGLTTPLILTEEVITVVAEGIAPATSSTIDLDAALSATLDSVHKILTVRRGSDSSLWSEVDLVTGTPLEADKTFTYDPSSGEMTFEADTLTAGEEFSIRVQYWRDIDDGEFILEDDGVTFPNSFDFTLTWLVKVESGPNTGRSGLMIYELKKCKRGSGTFEVGGDAQSVVEPSLEFTQNYEGVGDTMVYFTWIDALPEPEEEEE